MQEKVMRKLFVGFTQIHILHHGSVEPFYGKWMMEELEEHGYDMSPGTLYPMLKKMTADGLLEKQERNVNGKIRKYYRTTEFGEVVLNEARDKAYELFKEIEDK